MSVVTTSHDDFYRSRGRDTCSLCSNPVNFPFLEWDHKILFCSKCCQRVKRGFVADLIQVAAIRDLHDIGYPEFTLVRKDVKEIVREQTREHNERMARLRDAENATKFGIVS